MENLLFAMSTDDILAIKTKYSGNAEIVKTIDEFLAKRKATEDIAKVEAERLAKLNKLGKTLDATWTSDLHNILFVREDVQDLTKPEKVMVNGVEETRYPTSNMVVAKVNIFWSTNQTVSKVKANTDTTTTKKRAITVESRQGNAIVAIGNFTTGKAACVHLKVDSGVGSANLALRNAGYIVSAYDGNTFLS